jgi:Acyltransferase
MRISSLRHAVLPVQNFRCPLVFLDIALCTCRPNADVGCLSNALRAGLRQHMDKGNFGSAPPCGRAQSSTARRRKHSHRSVHYCLQCRTALAQGRSVLIFPEGTRKKVSDPVIFKRGVEFLYSQLGVPVLPVAVNSGIFWGRALKHSGTITVSYLPPIAPGLSPTEFKRIAEDSLQTEKERLVAQAATARPIVMGMQNGAERIR